MLSIPDKILKTRTYFGRRVPVRGEMELVLHRGEERPRDVVRPVVVDARRKDVRHFLVKIAFAHANVADALQQFTKIPTAISLQPIIVKSKTLDRKLMKMPNRPLPKPHRHIAPDPHADGKDHIEVIVRKTAFYAPFPFLSNLQKIWLFVHDCGYSFAA